MEAEVEETVSTTMVTIGEMMSSGCHDAAVGALCDASRTAPPQSQRVNTSQGNAHSCKDPGERAGGALHAAGAAGAAADI